MLRLAPAVTLAALLLAGACGADDDTQDPSRGLPRRGPSTGEPASRPATDPLRRPHNDRRPLLEKAPGSPTFVTQSETDEPEQPPGERDLPSELRGLLGDPAGCLNREGADDLPAEVRIRVDAHVSETGIVTRAYATAPSVPAASLECLQARLRFARFRAPVPDAPRMVSTQLTLRRRTPEAAASSGPPPAAP